MTGMLQLPYVSIQHAFVYLTERLESVSIQKDASRHRLGAGRHSRNGKTSSRTVRAFVGTAIPDTLTSTGSCKESRWALPFLLPKFSSSFWFLSRMKLLQERWHETS